MSQAGRDEAYCGEAQQVDRKTGQGGHNVGGIKATDTPLILAEGDISCIVDTRFAMVQWFRQVPSVSQEGPSQH